MKSVAIVCPGPSGLTCWGNADQDTYNNVIAVNACIDSVHAHYWVASDWQTLSMFKGRPSIGVVAPLASRTEANRLNICIATTYEELADTLPVKPPQCNYSGVAAMAFALFGGWKDITVFGMDLRPDGTSGRTLERFLREQQHLSHVLRFARTDVRVRFAHASPGAT